MEMWQEKIAEAVKEIKDYSADQIAQMFTEAGIKGDRGVSRKCPVAVWADRIACEHGGDYPVRQAGTGVGTVKVGGRSFPYIRAGGRMVCVLSPGLIEFIAGFDRGRYPQLVRRY